MKTDADADNSVPASVFRIVVVMDYLKIFWANMVR